MIDAVNINGTAPLLTASNRSTKPVAKPEAPVHVERVVPDRSAHVRVDNFLDLAILEVRSHETGDIINQFPTKQQIAAFQHAAELQRASDEQVPVQNAATATDNAVATATDNAVATATENTVATATETTATVEATATTSPVSSAVNVSAVNAGITTTQSITV